MTKIKKDGFYMVCESVHRIMAGVNALLDANIRIAMIKGSSWYYYQLKVWL